MESLLIELKSGAMEKLQFTSFRLFRSCDTYMSTYVFHIADEEIAFQHNCSVGNAFQISLDVRI